MSRNEWLEQAMEVLARKGGTRLRLDSLLESMSISKGSFYHHFRNKADFQAALFDYWDEHYTCAIAKNLAELPGSMPARDKLLWLMRILDPLEMPSAELMMRSVAVGEPEAARRVRECDRIRRSAVEALFRELGFEGDELETRLDAFIAVNTQVSLAAQGLSEAEIDEVLEARLAFFTRRKSGNQAD